MIFTGLPFGTTWFSGSGLSRPPLQGKPLLLPLLYIIYVYIRRLTFEEAGAGPKEASFLDVGGGLWIMFSSAAIP